MTMTPSDLRKSVTLFQIGHNKYVSSLVLIELLPDVETALFFAKAYRLNFKQLGELLYLLFRSDVLEALNEGDHSTDLQDYIIDTVPPAVREQMQVDFVDAPPPGQVLPQLWDSINVEIATSIQEVADKLGDVLDHLPGKAGTMVFKHMAQLNRQRQSIGTYAASIHHAPVPENLVVLDVSGSMTEGTIRKIVKDVVALGYKANAHLVIVSDTATHWEPGTYSVKEVLAAAEYNGTHYETLAPLLRRSWGTVVTIADYDSARSAKEYLASMVRGRIGKVLDISLVNRPTYLSECLGQFADEVRPLMISNSSYALSY